MVSKLRVGSDGPRPRALKKTSNYDNDLIPSPLEENASSNENRKAEVDDTNPAYLQTDELAYGVAKPKRSNKSPFLSLSREN